MPAVLSLFGTLIVVVLTAWLNTRMLSAQVEALRSELRAEIAALRAETHGEVGALRAEMAALRAEVKQGLAELRLEFHTQISELAHRVERLADRIGLVQRP
jgi:sensor domain CHASE-containing protein